MRFFINTCDDINIRVTTDIILPLGSFVVIKDIKYRVTNYLMHIEDAEITYVMMVKKD